MTESGNEARLRGTRWSVSIKLAFERAKCLWTKLGYNLQIIFSRIGTVREICRKCWPQNKPAIQNFVYTGCEHTCHAPMNYPVIYIPHPFWEGAGEENCLLSGYASLLCIFLLRVSLHTFPLSSWVLHTTNMHYGLALPRTSGLQISVLDHDYL